MLQIRAYAQADAAELLHLFTRAIEAIDERQYSAAQKAAWIVAAGDLPTWTESLQIDHVWLACEQGRLVGFIGLLLRPQAHVEFYFVEPTAQERGIGSALLTYAEQAAESADADQLSFYASKNSFPASRFSRDM